MQNKVHQTKKGNSKDWASSRFTGYLEIPCWIKTIIKGILKGCRLSGCELVGGETAEMPGTYEKGKFDIAGFAVGVVSKKKF